MLSLDFFINLFETATIWSKIKDFLAYGHVTYHVTHHVTLQMT